MNLKVDIAIVDELEESTVNSVGSLDLASGEISAVIYEDYDVHAQGLPARDPNYSFTSGILSHDGKDVEFRIDVDVYSGKYSVSADELLEIKLRAAKLFAGIEGQGLLRGAGQGQGEPRKKLH